jgi:hypothetical protein
MRQSLPVLSAEKALTLYQREIPSRHPLMYAVDLDLSEWLATPTKRY